MRTAVILIMRMVEVPGVVDEAIRRKFWEVVHGSGERGWRYCCEGISTGRRHNAAKYMHR